MNNDTEQKHQHISYFRNIEDWLKKLIAAEDSKNTRKLFEDGEIDNICSSISGSFAKEFAGLTPKTRVTILVLMLNTFIRIYYADQSDMITSQPNFPSMVKLFIKEIFKIIEDKKYEEYHAGMVDLLLINFAKDDFLIKCLKKFFPNEPKAMADHPVNEKCCSQSDITGAQYLLSKLVRFAANLSQTTVIQNATDFRNNYESCIISLLGYLDECFILYDEDNICKSKTKIIKSLLINVLNLTDKIPLLPMFISIDSVKTIVEWLTKLSFPVFFKNFGENIVGIVYNFSRHKQGLKALRKVGTFGILIEYKSHIMKSKRGIFKKLYGMLLIVLPKDDTEEKLNEDIILPISDQLFESSKSASAEKTWSTDGCHLSEYLYSLEIAFSNKFIVQHIFGQSEYVKKDRVEFFTKLFCSVYGLLFDEHVNVLDSLVIKSLLNIIFCISTYKYYNDKLKNDKILSIIIKSLAKQPNQDIAKRIWSNLQDSQLPLEQNKTPNIYISYNWADDDDCRQFVSHLSKKITIPIWVDYEKADELEDRWAYTAPAIESATIHIILLSSVYVQSVYNRQELAYALRTRSSMQKKHFLIVEIEDGFCSKSWKKNNGLETTETIQYRNKIEDLANEAADNVLLTKYRKFRSVFRSSDIATQSHVCILI